MKNRFIVLSIILAALFTACQKEDALTPSDKDQNLFERVDNPSSPVDHLIYQIYQETGIPIMYNDTVGRIPIGVGSDGEMHYLYQTADLVYQIIGEGNNDGYKGLRASLCTNDTTILEGVNLLNDRVIPQIPPALHVQSFLLVNYFEKQQSTAPGEYEYRKINGKTTHNSLLTTALAIEGIQNQTDEWKEQLAQDVLLTIFLSNISKNYPEVSTKFQEISSVEYQGKTYTAYSKYVSPYNSQTDDYNLLWALPEEYGFLEFAWGDLTYQYYGTLTSVEEDLESYLNAVLGMSDADFKAAYDIYPLVMQKYEMIQNILVNDWGYQQATN